MVLRKPDLESDPSIVRKPLVLVVDDDLEALSALRRSLRSESYNLLSTDDPFQALEWVKSGLISLIITDEFMPVMLGTELLEAVHRESPDTRTVLLTGFIKPPDLAAQPFRAHAPVMRAHQHFVLDQDGATLDRAGA